MLKFLFLFLILPLYAQEIHLPTVDRMAPVPEPLKIIDFKLMGENFDQKVFDFKARGRYWPLVWLDENHANFDEQALGIYTTIGDIRQGPVRVSGSFHEALANMGAVLGATLIGIDKSKQEYDYVSMLRNYFNRTTHWNIFQNNTSPLAGAQGGGYGRDWWYDVYPNLLFYGIYAHYPETPGFEEMARSVADKFYEADKILKGNYQYSYFDYELMIPVQNWICAQPDAAAGHSWVLYSAFKKFGDIKYLAGAKSALSALENNKINPSYEVLMPFGALMAAKFNALHDSDYDVEKLLNWTFDGTAVCREGWGVVVGKWNKLDVSGIVGSTVDHGGYGFLMNTFDMAWPLLPLVRYDQRFASAIGKWMLHAANAAKLFYPQHMPNAHQTLPEMKKITKGVIAYEGIAKLSTHEEYSHLPSPVAQGDGPKWIEGNPDVTQFSVYGSAHVGIFGGTVKKTNVEGILELDLLKTDFFRDEAYPTSLYYNPWKVPKAVALKNGNYYDLVSGSFLSGNRIMIPALSSLVLVTLPVNGKKSYEGKKTLVNGIVIDYRTKR
ncbi:MAG: hypothetical protein V4598_09700 [Bdellovibrionota bacterium]